MSHITVPEAERLRARIRAGEYVNAVPGTPDKAMFDWAVLRIYALERAAEARAPEAPENKP